MVGGSAFFVFILLNFSGTVCAAAWAADTPISRERIAQAPPAQDSRELERRIQARNRTLPPNPDYLYATDTITGTIATVWMDRTGRLLGTQDLRASYDEFYQAAVDYRGMAILMLTRAEKALQNNRLDLGNKYVLEADRYLKLLNLSSVGAIEAYNGNNEAAMEFARGIYQSSKASVKYGTGVVLGPWASRIVDGVFLVTDFVIDWSALGLSEAEARAVRAVVLRVMFDEVKSASLGGKTLSQFLSKATTQAIGSSRLYTILDEIIGSPEFERVFMAILAKSGAHLTKELAKARTKGILDELRTLSVPLPPQEIGVQPEGQAELALDPVRSLEGRVATEMLFENRSTESVLIYWINYQGEEVFYRELRAGDSYRQQTYVTHPWRIRAKNTRTVIKTVAANSSTTQIVVIEKASDTTESTPTMEVVTQQPRPRDQVEVRTSTGEVRPLRIAPVVNPYKDWASLRSIADVLVEFRPLRSLAGGINCNELQEVTVNMSEGFCWPCKESGTGGKASEVADDALVREIFTAGLAETLKQCPNFKTERSPRPIVVRMVGLRISPTDKIEAIYLREGADWKLHSYRNGAAEDKKRLETEKAAQEARMREQKARLEAESREQGARREARIAAARQELAAFLEKYGAREAVSCSELSVNPFTFAGQVVAVPMHFDSMLERDRGLFATGKLSRCAVVASGIPAGTFSTRRVYVLVAGRVIGKTDVKLPFGPLSVPHLKFVGAHICREADCAEFWPE